MGTRSGPSWPWSARLISGAGPKATNGNVFAAIAAAEALLPVSPPPTTRRPNVGSEFASRHERGDEAGLAVDVYEAQVPAWRGLRWLTSELGPPRSCGHDGACQSPNRKRSAFTSSYS